MTRMMSLFKAAVVSAAVSSLIVGSAKAQTDERVAKFEGGNLVDSTITEYSGNVGIGTPSPGVRLHLAGTDNVGYASTIQLQNQNPGGGNAFITASDAYWDAGAGKLLFGLGDSGPYSNNVRMAIDGSGNVGIGTSTPRSRLEIIGQDGLSISGYQPFLTLRDTNAANRSAFIQSVDGQLNFIPQSFQGGSAAVVIKNVSGNMGVGTDQPTAKLDVAGMTKTRVLQITGGSDLSEKFEIGNGPREAKPGMVVAIDRKNPGKLVLSGSAYDRRVAGVVSGAGGVQPGMLMGQANTLADGDQPVALSGRVFVWADASTGAIAPGDMLTTSDVAGHAMKAVDQRKAHGATIGKAMTGLSHGRGLVLVLVTLQ